MEKHQTQLPPGAASTISPLFSFSLSPSIYSFPPHLFLPLPFISFSLSLLTQTEMYIQSERDNTTISSQPLSETEDKIQSAPLAEISCRCMLQCRLCVCVSVLFPQNGDTSTHHDLKARMLHNSFLRSVLIEVLLVALQLHSHTPVRGEAQMTQGTDGLSR